MKRYAPWVLIMACASITCRAGFGHAEDVSLTVETTGPQSCRVNGVFTVDASSVAVWSVLTDYAHMPGFITGMKKSRIIQRQNNSLLLDQTASGKFLFFSHAIHVLLKVTEHPDNEIDFEDVSHEDFESYRGSWRIEGAPPSVLVLYSLASTRKFSVPNFIARVIFRKNAENLLVDVRNEILQRVQHDETPTPH